MTDKLCGGAEPKLGDRRNVTAEELGLDRAAEIVKRSTSPRVALVRELLRYGTSTQAIFAQQYVESSHKKGEVVARTKAIAATGWTPGGVAVSAVYTSDFASAFSAQAEALRYGTNTIWLKRGEGTDVFGYVGPWHMRERLSFMQAEFEVVRPNQVAANALVTVRDWVRGVDLIWLKLPSLKAAQAADRLWSDLEQIQQYQEKIARAYANGYEPDPQLVRKCEVLKFGLDGYGMFFGFQHGTELERDPTADCATSLKKAPLTIEQR